MILSLISICSQFFMICTNLKCIKCGLNMHIIVGVGGLAWIITDSFLVMQEQAYACSMQNSTISQDYE